MFIPYLKTKKRLIDDELIKSLNNQSKQLQNILYWGKPSIDRIKNFSVLGKTIRGCLVILGAEIFGYTNYQVLLPLAASIELIHSSFLIHDDIMDNDMIRRNQPSIFASYLPFGPIDFAKSMGICAGDLSFFIALNQVAAIDMDSNLKNKIFFKLTEEVNKVVIAQMADVYFGYTQNPPTITDINNIYRYKTARYSFSLPLAIGATTAKQTPSIIKKLEKLGEYIGLVFQIIDDQIGLTSDEVTIGKPVGSDIRENKKTYIRHLLYQEANIQQKKQLDALFGNKNINKNDVQKVKSLLAELKILPIIEKRVNYLTTQADKIIASLPVDQHYKDLLVDMTTMLKKRVK